MLLLLQMLLLGQQADIAKLISTLARVQGVSANGLATRCSVQKSALLRFCKGQQGGYLSQEARDRVLKELGWSKEGLSSARVHTWKIDRLDDAQFLLGLALQGRARLSLLEARGSNSIRIAVGVVGDTPLVVFATYDVPPNTEDPIIAKSMGPYEPATGIFVDLRVLEAARQSPKSFFKIFRERPSSPSIDAKVASVLADSPALKRLADLGFEESAIDALVDDFLSMQCRVDPLSMRERLKKQWQAQHSSPGELCIAAAMEGAVDTYLTERAARPYAHSWLS